MPDANHLFAWQHIVFCNAPSGARSRTKRPPEIRDMAVYFGVNMSVGMQPAAATAVNLPDADLESD
jgi:hypothetical protein